MYQFAMVSFWLAVPASHALHVAGACKHIIAVTVRALLRRRQYHGIVVRVLQPLGTHFRVMFDFSRPCGSERMW